MNKKDNYRYILACLIFFYSISTQAQKWYELDSSAQLKTEYQTAFLNNSIENATLKWLLGGQAIDQNAWKQQAENLLTINKVMGWTKAGVTFTQMADSNNKRPYFVNYQYQDVSTAQFSRDLGGLIMLGNGPYEDYSLNLDNSSINVNSFHRVHLGTIIQLPKGKLKLSGGLHFGTFLNSVDLKSGFIYTAEDGEYLDVAYDYKRTSSLFGIGAGIDVQFYTPLEKGFFEAEINNIGAMVWSGDAKTTIKDTSFRYNGLLVTNPNTLGFNEVSDEIDSIQDDLLGIPTLESTTTLIPIHFTATYGMEITADQSLSLRVDGLINTSSLMHWETLTHHWQIKPSFKLNSGIQVFDFNAINWCESIQVQNKLGFIDLGLMGIETAFLGSDKGGFGVLLGAGVNL